MKNLTDLLQRLDDNGAKPNSILCFFRDLYEYELAYYKFESAPTKGRQREYYNDYARRRADVRDWLETFHLDDTYKPEDFIEQ